MQQERWISTLPSRSGTGGAVERSAGFAVARPPGQALTGKPIAWTRDLAIVGGATGALAPAAVIMDPAFSIVAGLVGIVTGALLGLMAQTGLERLRRVVPLSLLILAGPFVGAAWGAASGAAGGWVAGQSYGSDGVWLGAMFGGLAGMLQFGWMWLPYTVQSVLRGRTWPVVALACIAAPFLGWAGFFGLMLSPLLAPPAAIVAAALAVYTFKPSIVRRRGSL